jgi:hypothetical protein
MWNELGYEPHDPYATTEQLQKLLPGTRGIQYVLRSHL